MVRFSALMEELRQKVKPLEEARGRQFFEEFKANVTTAYDGEVRAGVNDGRQRYKVRLGWNGQGYSFSCSCGAGPDQVCEHVWATVLTASEDGYFDGQHPGGYWNDDDDDVLENAQWPASRPRGGSGNGSRKARRTPRWRQALERLTSAPPASSDAREAWPPSRQIAYVIDREDTLVGKGLVVELCTREPRQNGELSKPKPVKIAKRMVAELPCEQDRIVVAMLAGGERSNYGYYYEQEAARFRLNHALARAALPLMCRSGRCLMRTRTPAGAQEYWPLGWGGDAPWELRVRVRAEPKEGVYVIEGVLARDAEERPISAPSLLTAGGLVFWDGVVEPLQDWGAFPWVVQFREREPLRVPLGEARDLAARLYAAGPMPALQLPDELKLEEVHPPLSRHLKISPPDTRYDYYADPRLRAELSFEYDGHRVAGNSAGRAIVQGEHRRAIVRDAAAEAEAVARLQQLGFRNQYSYRERKEVLTLTPNKLAKTVSALVAEGWHVQAEGKLYRQPGEFKIEVTSGIDWFELHGTVEFGDQRATLPQLLSALRKGESLVTLGDGTVGMLPEQWLKKYGVLAGMGRDHGDHLRFARAQAGVLDALLAAQPEATCDAVFERTRQMLRSFDGIKPAEPPAGFRGELRAYQKDGLGWMRFLRDFSFGGCLADDMGLGKTVQVLAMLLGRRGRRGGKRDSGEPRLPSLVVVPRSLVFNWLQESARFAPKLRVLDHSHTHRARAADHFADYDVVLTTYGMLRRDAAYLKDADFDYVILDEAQAIKNASSESAKAARLLHGRHRLALSGTPVQNHLGDLWSLFEFLNPGMLGSSSALSASGNSPRALDEATRSLLARAVRPFILRRTKEQVARDLPAKLEQTIYCELEPEQRKHYEELKNYYRANLLELIATEGINKAKIRILEALLRLRQAACHPGLIDKGKAGERSAKLDVLLARLDEVVNEGHKALVFSQFTSFLSIVKGRLDAEKVKYEYLDGKTRDRQARVDRFQSDGGCKLFLVSLKAGGLGLNLTAADYVFLLDPWWNPAVEAQAIDRTHRIGQSKQVFACRLIAKDTVEEKVLALQQSKRQLADAIINADNSLLTSLRREDLELLLS